MPINKSFEDALNELDALKAAISKSAEEIYSSVAVQANSA